MSRSTLIGSLALTALTLGGVGYAAVQHDKGQGDEHSMMQKMQAHAVCVLQPTEGSEVKGVVEFHTLSDGGVQVTAEVSGLEPNSEHGFHVHEYGDMTDPSGKSLGGHFNPEGHEHGLPPAPMRHAGDMGNLKAGADGVAHFSATFHDFTLGGMHDDVIGRGIIVHAKPDDGGQPTGNAGARVAMGVIGIAK